MANDLAPEASNPHDPGRLGRRIRGHVGPDHRRDDLHGAGVPLLPDVGRPAGQRTSETLDVQLSLSRCGEGTANLYSASSTFLNVGFHLYSDCEVDRQGRGTTDWATWTATRDERLDNAILAYGVTGGIGDRDVIRYAGADLHADRGAGHPGATGGRSGSTCSTMPPATPSSWASATHAGSTAFTNPTVAQVEIDGRQAILVTLFVPQEGARGDEVGELIYYRTLDPPIPADQHVGGHDRSLRSLPSERRRDVLDRKRRHVARGAHLALRQLDVPVREELVGHLAQEVAMMLSRPRACRRCGRRTTAPRARRSPRTWRPGQPSSRPSGRSASRNRQASLESVPGRDKAGLMG